MQIRIAIIVFSLVLMAVVAAIGLRTTTEQWHGYQQRYYKLAAERTDNPAVKKAVKSAKLEIKQDIVKHFGKLRVDRCRTCHTAIDDPNFANDSQPLRTHSAMHPHPFNEFGCTICHEGNGRGLSTADAHGTSHFWPEPLLVKPYIESSCVRCHSRPYPRGTDHLQRGEKLFVKYTCVGCHTVQNVSRGKLGAELTDVGNRMKLKAIHAKIINPKADVALSIMPTFNMPKVDRIDLVVYLKSRRGRAIIEDPISYRRHNKKWLASAAPEVPVSLAEGQKAFDQRGCLSCHKVSGSDGKLAPELTWLGKLRRPDYVAEHLRDPRGHTPGSSMPSFFMSRSEREAIALYLQSLQQVQIPPQPADQYKLLCVRCHGAKGDGKGLIAHNLVPRPRTFTNDRFFNWLPEARAHDAIREGIAGTAMPPFKSLLSMEQAKALFAHVRTEFIKKPRPTRKSTRVIDPAPYGFSSAAANRGKSVFLKRCYGCHGRLGDGRGPNAPDMVPRPRNLRNHGFFTRVSDARIYESIKYGIVGTGMPPWDVLTRKQRWDLIYFVRRLSKTGPAVKKGGQ
jgi:mono/diheme cytochrome c family protein